MATNTKRQASTDEMMNRYYYSSDYPSYKLTYPKPSKVGEKKPAGETPAAPNTSGSGLVLKSAEATQPEGQQGAEAQTATQLPELKLVFNNGQAASGTDKNALAYSLITNALNQRKNQYPDVLSSLVKRFSYGEEY